VDLTAELVHVTRVALPGETPFYLTGFEFLAADRSTREALDRLIGHVAQLCVV
jgi:hypothetical protein